MIQRLLFINSLHFDYLEDLMFASLTELLGANNVISFPTNYHYYFSKYRYPKNIGQCRAPLRYVIDRVIMNKRIQKSEFDAVVIGSTKEDAFLSYLRIADRLPLKIPLVYIDGGDRPEVGGDAIRENFIPLFERVCNKRKINLIFKREYHNGREYDKNVFPLPFAFKPTAYNSSIRNKKYDVVFWAVESDPIRTEVLRMVHDRYDCKENGTVTGLTFRKYQRRGKNFLEELSASKVAYNFKGVGWNTLRYWEIPGVASFMISGAPQIRIPNNFKDREHIVLCRDDLSDLLRLTDYYLHHENEREEIARNGHSHLQQHHTYIKRGEYFLNICNDFLSTRK
jgi:Glycosyl transferases group 1